jgi:hypothetical protein
MLPDGLIFLDFSEEWNRKIYQKKIFTTKLKLR